MIRSNIGNIATNAIQTMAISATTGAQMKRADEAHKLQNRLSGVNLLSKEEQEIIGEASAKKRLDTAKEYLSEDDIGEEQSVDDLMSETYSFVDKANSPQSGLIKGSIDERVKYINGWEDVGGNVARKYTYKDLKTGKFIKDPNIEKESV